MGVRFRAPKSRKAAAEGMPPPARKAKLGLAGALSAQLARPQAPAVATMGALPELPPDALGAGAPPSAAPKFNPLAALMAEQPGALPRNAPMPGGVPVGAPQMGVSAMAPPAMPQVPPGGGFDDGVSSDLDSLGTPLAMPPRAAALGAPEQLVGTPDMPASMGPKLKKKKAEEAPMPAWGRRYRPF